MATMIITIGRKSDGISNDDHAKALQETVAAYQGPPKIQQNTGLLLRNIN